MENYIKCQLIKAELEIVNLKLMSSEIRNEPILIVVLIKSAIINLNNVKDLAKPTSYYRKYPFLKEQYKDLTAEWEMFNYIRNKIAGHVDTDLIYKSMELNPQLKECIHYLKEKDVAYHYYESMIETLFLTCVDNDGNHVHIFGSTDGVDISSFLKVLKDTVERTIIYLNDLSSAIYLDIEGELYGESQKDRLIRWENSLTPNLKRLK
ncbi:hypothetical protein [Vibrio vulnificus]|uniref:hypothetical protein n=1 Tax=Vibrio vulnificus TaxID=672 RepID=UPI0032EF5DBA